MAQPSNRCLEPTLGGDQVLSGFDSERKLPSLSRSAVLVAAFLLVLAPFEPSRAGSAEVPPAPRTSVSGPLLDLLAPLESGLAAACTCETLRVEWSIAPALAARATQLESLAVAIVPSASSPAPSAGQGGSPAHQAPAGGTPVVSVPDRVAVRISGLERGRSVRLWIEGRALCHARVPLARHRVRPGQILQESDFEYARGWFPPSALRGNEPSPAGTYAVSGLAAGAWIPRADLREPPLIHRNETLRVIYESGGLRLEARGTARRDGWAGDSVPLRVQGAERDCEGVVVGPGEVRVGPEG